eukprot:TRINITY_DN16889_c0_g1_i1.p1 TRINITY_DN16889_c0_g1~~TRINITY_DN16889_c0_g1_i1.p1  ORF type:complete len:317 (+),score=100.82 TRINITY_DN16889_c0_g1_i1:17-967(+)
MSSFSFLLSSLLLLVSQLESAFAQQLNVSLPTMLPVKERVRNLRPLDGRLPDRSFEDAIAAHEGDDENADEEEVESSKQHEKKSKKRAARTKEKEDEEEDEKLVSSTEKVRRPLDGRLPDEKDEDADEEEEEEVDRTHKKKKKKSKKSAAQTKQKEELEEDETEANRTETFRRRKSFECGEKRWDACTVSRCCASGLTCYEKDSLFAQCLPSGSCKPGVHHDRVKTHLTALSCWSCYALSNSTESRRKRKAFRCPELEQDEDSERRKRGSVEQEEPEDVSEEIDETYSEEEEDSEEEDGEASEEEPGSDFPKIILP